MSVVGLTEGRLDDNNTTFTNSAGDVFNGMTVGGTGDDTRGAMFNYLFPMFTCSAVWFPTYSTGCAI